MEYHKKNALFLHIPKCGGTSVEHALLDLDPMTSGQMQVQDYCGRHYLINYQHAFPNELLSTWRYFTFTFVRNPWDRFVSYYFHLKKLKLLKVDIDFNTFVKKFFYGGLQNLIAEISSHKDDYHLFMQPCHSWAYSADYVGRFENFQNDFDAVCDILDIEKRKLKVLNPTIRKEYSLYYNPESIEMIGNYYRIDIDNYAYEF